MDELIAFWRARLDENERTAKGLMGATRFVDGAPDFYGVGGPAAEAFWNHFDPHRAVREVKADRMLLTMYENLCAREKPSPGTLAMRQTLEEAVKIRASVHCNHPDYKADDWGAWSLTGSSASGRS